MQGRTDTQALITPYNSQVSLPHSSPFTSSAFFDMAITHDDLSLRRHKFSNINSKLAHSLVVFSVVCGLFSFILCLTAEAARSEVSWMIINRPSNEKSDMCIYSGSGKTALLCAVVALLLLAVAMFTEHANMLVVVTSTQQPAIVPWTSSQNPRVSHSSKAFTLQACILIITTWICFAIAEVLLLVGIVVESSHLRNWTQPRSSCPAVRPGMFAAAGVFGLVTIFLGVGLYLTALLAQKLDQQDENIDPSEYMPHQGYPHSIPAAPQLPFSAENQLHDKASTSAV
ncbi:uncharacterized protein LOC120273428 [Dioscorea cayenensis subsp. rotundata]|uniref:Uncharacterized protein LOC120273428 n=1 Tax=Dioscorea cayennensis subsp. rotundata TaxID=55577 RepID=A0AB40C808_DIOCR|nr:uncharacterized protein LOC120273428 [Dioscorea cayenensis subsp. rotundata]